MKRENMTPRDHFFLIYGKLNCDISDVIENYVFQVENNPESEFWKECLEFAKEWKKDNKI
jgi:hypothetical protein